jgi:hypothetical protein
MAQLVGILCILALMGYQACICTIRPGKEPKTSSMAQGQMAGLYALLED